MDFKFDVWKKEIKIIPYEFLVTNRLVIFQRCLYGVAVLSYGWFNSHVVLFMSCSWDKIPDTHILKQRFFWLTVSDHGRPSPRRNIHGRRISAQETCSHHSDQEVGRRGEVGKETHPSRLPPVTDFRQICTL